MQPNHLHLTPAHIGTLRLGNLHIFLQFINGRGMNSFEPKCMYMLASNACKYKCKMCIHFFIHLIHFTVSDLFDVNINSTVEEMSKKTEIRIPWGSGIVGHVAASGRPVNITDCYADERFNPVSHQFPFIFFFS